MCFMSHREYSIFYIDLFFHFGSFKQGRKLPGDANHCHFQWLIHFMQIQIHKTIKQLSNIWKIYETHHLPDQMVKQGIVCAGGSDKRAQKFCFLFFKVKLLSNDSNFKMNLNEMGIYQRLMYAIWSEMIHINDV